MNIEKWLPFLLAKAHQHTNALMRLALDDYKLTPPQFAALAFLWQKEGLNQQELGSLMNVDRTTIGGTLERLERLELVQRGQDPRDRRSWVVFVTKKGKRLRENILPSLKKVSNEIDRNLTLMEQETLAILLDKIRLG